MNIHPFIKNNRYYFLLLFLFLLSGVIVYSQTMKGAWVLYCAEHRSAFWNFFFSWGTRLGEGYLFLFFFIILLFVRFSNALILGCTGVVVLFLSKALKYYFDWARPSTYFAELVDPPVLLEPVPGVELVQSWTSTFPSGHTMAAFAMYGILAFSFQSQAIKVAAWSLAVIVGLSRIYLGQHFLNDVIAGAFFGTMVALLMFVLQGQLSRWAWARKSLLRM